MAQSQIKEVPERWIASDQGRQVIYIILAAVMAVLTALDILDGEAADQLLQTIVQVAGLLGFSLAAANKPKPAPAERAG